MPLKPDLPFPKSAGDAIRSKDWNDLVSETQRLDNAKLNRSGDAITGPLTIAGALSVGTTASNAKLDVAGKLDVTGDLRINNAKLYLRSGADTNHGLGWFGPGAMFAGESVDGPVLFGNSGGALGSSLGGQKVALRWDSNGKVGFGVPAPDFKVDVAGRIRLRQEPSGSAGLWFYQTTPADDRAFFGMMSDDTVGLFGNKGANWALTVDVTHGSVGVRTSPSSNVGLYVSGVNKDYGLYVWGGTSYGLYTTGKASIGGDLRVAGKVSDQNIRSSVYASNRLDTTSTSYVDMPNMSMTIASPGGSQFLIMVNINGVQVQGGTTIGAYFRLLVDGTQWDMTRHEFNHNGWELRGVHLSRLLSLAAGSHTISVQWAVTSGTLTCCWYGDGRQIQVIEL
ncbi:MAG: hypothetical protein AW10_02781 [Candidatus Accumulibacter appositus]|uniref:Uncharacterized protein n=1 Tax=Candidatus Accumulibacter appositus TaxID=1454003 RepID=A0A011NTV1_9PROT|nr:hypothetical protein [Accumulibacter sp.]EXI78791.1 MAG: hypothetical protein AW10_02781 [Candidatus Accumulibacter appositus]HRF05801.1 hypothetical protein [Accumulibacter sp.]